ncbi:MAG: hypothetical protein AB1649_11015 [Chloroflexota bacterium]
MKFILPRIRDILFLSILVGTLLLAPRMLNIDSDLGRHLALGQYMLDAREIPLTDILSHTKSGEPRPPYEWLSQILFALAYRALSLDGVILLTALVIAIAWALIYKEAARRSGLPVTALLITILAAAASSVHWLPRPHVFTFPFLAIWVERLDRLRSGEKIPLWHFPLLMLFWANLHGGFVFGVLAWLAFIAGWVIDRWQRQESATTEIAKNFLLIGGLSILASFVTPSGWGNWRGVLGNSSTYILSRTVETMSPDFYQTQFWPFLILLALCLIVPSLSGVRLPVAHAFLLAGFAVLSLMMARNIPLFTVVAAPILASSARHLLDSVKLWVEVESRLLEIERTLRGLAWPIAGSFVIVILLVLQFSRTHQSLARFDARVFPVAAVDWLKENPPQGKMYNEFNWGGYLLFRLWPEQKVFIDSQTDFYGEELVSEYDIILSAYADLEAKLTQYDVDWVIVRNNSAVAVKLSRAENWRLVYVDDVAVILKQVKHP